MRVGVFSTRGFDREFLNEANRAAGHELDYFEARLDETSAPLAFGMPAVCAFVNDRVNEQVLRLLHGKGLRAVVLRSAGFNHVDLAAAQELRIDVLRVPAYSPHAVAEHTLALMLALNRKTHKAYNRVREQNFSLEGLIGFDMHQKTVGIIGTGKIGAALARALVGLGCSVIAHDPSPDAACLAMGVEYVEIATLFARADIITLHCPLTPASHHMIDEQALARMKPGVMLVNTSRGGLVDSRAVIEALKQGRLGSLGLDVYEEEADLFFHDLSEKPIQDDIFVRLLTFPNVLITAHQAFLTREALQNIASTTIRNISDVEHGTIDPARRVTAAKIAT